ncbi:hypothetical protein BBJ28_00007983 [Nothophytophthora sp. Chile5]|nr:hypothetical protein BBJ28_00007983 [Nothophytophthora sp. Chile5]
MRNTVPINGLNFVRKYEDADRIVLVGTATWFLPADGLQFQDHVWTIVTRSPIDPLNASVVQTFCQFGAKCPGKGSARAEDFVRSQDYVLGSVGRKLRQLQELQQKALLEQVQLATTMAV